MFSFRGFCDLHKISKHMNSEKYQVVVHDHLIPVETLLGHADGMILTG